MIPYIEKIWISARPLFSYGITAVLSALIGTFFSYQYFKKQKRYEFSQRRLDEFYSPLVGNIKQIRANAELHVKVTKASQEAWREICDRNPKPFHEHDKYFAPFKKQIDEENTNFHEIDIPIYDAMLALFKLKNHLAFPSTMKWFSIFSEYVTLWHCSLPSETKKKLTHSEEPLLAFYSDVEEQYNKLKRKHSGDKQVK